MLTVFKLFNNWIHNVSLKIYIKNNALFSRLRLAKEIFCKYNRTFECLKLLLIAAR